jgi:alpha-beta hydrolase superfamily lysophospholipase
MSSAREWVDDVLGGFENTTLTLPAAKDGPVDVVLVRRKHAAPSTKAVLYVHGYLDYFFHSHLADFYERRGFRFYAVDLRRHGRALRDHQRLSYIDSIDEYIADVDHVVRVLVGEEGVTWLMTNGHSTGGLVTALHAHRGEQRAAVDALVLNSPFVNVDLPRWQRLLLPIVLAVGRVTPHVTMGAIDGVYGGSLHADHHGEWSFDEEWKPLSGRVGHLGWLRAIRGAHGEISRGLGIAQPVQLLRSSRSLRAVEWHPDVMSADIVLNVDDMERSAPRLGSRVEVAVVPDGMHDLALSQAPARTRMFDLHDEWLARVAPR